MPGWRPGRAVCCRSRRRGPRLFLGLGELVLAARQLGRDPAERRLAFVRRLFAARDRGAAELDGTELLLADRDVAFGRPDLLLAGPELEGQSREGCVSLVELGGAVTEHLLDRAAEAPGLLLAAFEVGDRRLQLLRALLDLSPALADQRLRRLLVVGGGEQRFELVPDAVVGASPAGPVLPLAISSRLF